MHLDEIMRMHHPTAGELKTIGDIWTRAVDSETSKAASVTLTPTRKVANLFDKNNRTRIYGYFASTGTAWSYSELAYSNKIPCKPNTTYTARYNGNSTQVVLGFGSCSTDAEPSSSVSTVTVTQGIRKNSPTVNTPVTITTGPNDKWLIVAWNVAEPQHTDMADNLQIEEGATATPLYPSFSPAKVMPSLKAFGGTPVKHKQDKLWGRYVPCEYIESNGTEYIDTGIIPTVAKETEILLKMSANAAEANGFGANRNLNIESQSPGAVWRLNGKVTSVSRVANEIIDVELKQTSSGRYYKLKTEEGYGSANQETFSFCIGKLNGGSSSSFKGKYYRVVIKESNAIILDLIPVKDVVANVYGMFDRVTNTFYGNSGAGTITGGELIQPISYAESDGTAWADTKIIPTTFDYTITYEGAIKSLTGPACAWGYMGGSGNLPRWLCAGHNGNTYLLNANATFVIQGADTNNHTFVAKVYEISGEAKWSSEIDGVVKQNNQTLASADTWTSNTLSIYLFARHNADGVGNLAPATLKRWICEKNGVVIKHYIPVRIGTTVELLDLVSWTFATRTGTFSAGADIPLTEIVPDIITVNTGNLLYGGKNKFDKSITANLLSGYVNNVAVGESTAYMPYAGGDKSILIPVKPSTTYTIKRKTGILAAYDRIRVAGSSSGNTSNLTMLINITSNKTQESATFTTLADTTAIVFNCRNSGAVGDDWQQYLDALMLVEGSVAPTEYEPYYAGIHTDGSHKVTVKSKNLFDISALAGSSTVSVSGSTITINGTNVSTGKTLHQLCPDLKAGDTCYLYMSDESTTANKYIWLRGGAGGGQWSKNQVITLTQADLDGTVKMYAGVSGQTIVDMMVVKGTTAPTEYSPYAGQSISRDVPTLYSADSFVDVQKAENNKTEYWAVKVLDGTDYKFTNVEVSGNKYWFYNLDFKIDYISESNFGDVLSDRFVGGYKHLDATTMSRSGVGFVQILGSAMGGVTTVAEANAWLETHCPIVLYPLAVPAVSTVPMEHISLTQKAQHTVTAEAELAVTVQATYLGKEGIYYTITATDSHCSHTGPTSVMKGDTASLVYSAASGYQLDQSCFTVTGATGTFANGVLTLSNITGNVTVQATATEIRYSITVNATHCTYSGDTTIGQTGTASITFTADTGYTLDSSSFTVTGATGTFANGVLTLSNATGNVTVDAVAVEVAAPSYLCFTANTAGSTVELTKKGSPSISGTAYSLDGVNWTTFSPSTTAGTNKVTLANVGDKVYFKNNINSNFTSTKYLMFVMSGSISASGNINSMYSAEGFESLTTLTYEQCYYRLFYNCSALTTAPELPAVNLSNMCYYSTFYGCTSLTTAPELPAVNPSYGCYEYMFYGCTSLTATPALPAISLTDCCYMYMFYGCESLVRIQGLPATTLAYRCYDNMFAYCASLITAPALPAISVAESCYQQMFRGCTSLTTPSALPATILAYRCYAGMYSECESLNKIPALPAPALAEQCYEEMFGSCTKIKMSLTQTSVYKNTYTFGAIPDSTYADYMFADTGGSFNDTPTRQTLYTSNTIVE